MNLEHFKTYTTDDFILDEDFREIVKNPCSEQLTDLLKFFPEKKMDINLAVQILRELQTKEFQQTEKRKEELWQQILRNKRKRISMLYFRYAASIIMLIGIGSALFYHIGQKSIDEVVVSSIPTNDALLILSDGKTIPINSEQSTVQYSSDGSGIIVNDSSGITLPFSGNQFNQLIVPYGKRSFITLSEGTKVWLNSGSRLVFPPVFKGKTREVVLEGEAFFDVTPNKDQPFFVKTDAFKMKVYGTKFNVQAYQQDKEYCIVLVEGKVSMNSTMDKQKKEIFLAPNQKSILAKGEETFEISVVENTEVYTAWIDGYLTFINEDVSDLLKRVSRYYNVSIESELPEHMETIYGKLDLKDDLERVLDGIAFISKTKYEKQGNTYVFMNI